MFGNGPLFRRDFLRRGSLGFGWLAFAGLAARAEDHGDKPRGSHFAPRARNVIFLFMDGGVSHVDSFDPKPELDKRHGQSVGNWKADSKSQSVGPGRKWLKSPWTFAQYGQSGLPVSSLFPHIAAHAD